MNIKAALLTASILAASVPAMAGPYAVADLGTVNDVTVGSLAFPIGVTNATTYSFNTGTVSTSTGYSFPVTNATATGVGGSGFVATTDALAVGLGPTLVGSSLEALNLTGLEMAVRATGTGVLGMEALAGNQVVGEAGAVGGSLVGGPTVSLAGSGLEAYGMSGVNGFVSRTCAGPACVNNYSGTAAGMSNVTGYAGVVTVGVAPFSGASVSVSTLSSSVVTVD